MPKREENSVLFSFMFLVRLPEQIQVMLSEDPSNTVPGLAARADQQIQSRAPMPGAAIPAITKDSGVVAAATPQDAWPQHLPWALLGLRAAPKEDGGLPSAELV